MPSGHIGIPEGEVPYNSECPECGSGEVRRSDTYDLEELDKVSLWCDVCGYSWWEEVDS